MESPISVKTDKSPQIIFDEASSIERIKENGAIVDLNTQWDIFWDLRKNGKDNKTESNIIPDRALIHNLRYDASALDGIFRSGIIASDIEFGQPEGALGGGVEDETPFCADFFVNTYGDMDPASYAQEAYKKDRSEFGTFFPREEGRSPSPWNLKLGKGPDTLSVQLVIAPNQDLERLLELSANDGLDSINHNNLDKFGVNFPRENGRHTAVLVGVPANYISKVIVSGSVEGDDNKIDLIKKSLVVNELDIPVFSVLGNKL